jgi:hypothetical protein
MRKRQRLRERLTYANVVSTLCLFLLVGGGAAFAALKLPKNSVGTKQLKKNAVTTAKIKKNAVTGAKVKESTLGTVPSAQSANDAAALGGAPAASFAKSELEPVHVVGTAGEPSFGAGCGGFLGIPVGFYKDPFGVVHLRGYVVGCASESTPAFTLPGGFRPQAQEFFAAVQSNTEASQVEIDASGAVQIWGGKSATLSGIEFRTR